MESSNLLSMRGRITGPHMLELGKDVSLPIGSSVSVFIGFEDTKKTIDRFRAAAGSWKHVSEDLISTLYADRAISRRRDAHI